MFIDNKFQNHITLYQKSVNIDLENKRLRIRNNSNFTTLLIEIIDIFIS